jgi:acyl-homoserine lactone acylase PvdQ
MAVAALAPAPAAAQLPIPIPIGGQPPQPPAITAPVFGQFRSVLAQGEGQSINASDLAAYEGTGNAPDSFVNQQPLYAGVMPAAGGLTPGDLDKYYKPTTFGSIPGGIGSTEEPHSGVQIFRDKQFQMAHVYGDNRYDLMWGAGYATAEERLFLMDVLRHLAKGRLAELLGPSAASSDEQQLTDQDFSDQELTDQFNALPARVGPDGQRAHDDILAYIDGINARIQEVNNNPAELPAEYPALGTRPAAWTISDTAAEAVFLVTQFTVSNGGEEINAQLQEAFQKRFGANWRAPYNDLREANDPEAFTVAHTTFASDAPGPVQPGRNAMPDFGSIKTRNPLVSGPSQSASAQAKAAAPAWVRSIESLKNVIPHVESNAVMVSPAMSSDGRPLSAMGPQVGYYSPQIFSEYELHGGGIDSEGVVFPGAAPWPLIGHGIDFAWTGTSANGDNEDTFVERLCNQDGSPPSQQSTSYAYRGRCIPFTMRDQTVSTPVTPTDPTTPPQQITYRTMRSVHGPVFAFATVGGQPAALTKAKAVDFRELEAAVPFMRLSENEPNNVRAFQSIMGTFPGSENWFYIDSRNVGFLQSGVYPRHAAGADVDLPFNGDGSGDWQGFNPAAYTYQSIPPSHRPQAISPDYRFIISWNNKEAPGWRKGPREWSNGPVHHAMILQEKLLDQARAHGGKVGLTELTRAVNLAATTDLRGEDDYPLMRRVIGQATGRDEQMLKILDDWHGSGSQRLDANGDNVYDHSAAVALMDAWWTRFVTAEFQPGLGDDLFSLVKKDALSLGDVSSDFGWDWGSQAQKDLRNVVGQRERGRYSHVYCGGFVSEPLKKRALASARTRCRGVLLSTLEAAIAGVSQQQGTDDPSQWKVAATCKIQSPPACDQNVPTTAGAVDTPPFPWQNRGTYHQIDEITGARPGAPTIAGTPTAHVKRTRRHHHRRR